MAIQQSVFCPDCREIDALWVSSDKDETVRCRRCDKSWAMLKLQRICMGIVESVRTARIARHYAEGCRIIMSASYGGRLL